MSFQRQLNNITEKGGQVKLFVDWRSSMFMRINKAQERETRRRIALAEAEWEELAMNAGAQKEEPPSFPNLEYPAGVWEEIFQMDL